VATALESASSKLQPKKILVCRERERHTHTHTHKHTNIHTHMNPHTHHTQTHHPQILKNNTTQIHTSIKYTQKPYTYTNLHIHKIHTKPHT
jgi:hypothetical protein